MGQQRTSHRRECVLSAIALVGSVVLSGCGVMDRLVDRTPTVPPTNVTAQAVGHDQIVVSWSPVPGVHHYTISYIPGSHWTFSQAQSRGALQVQTATVSSDPYTLPVYQSGPYTLWVQGGGKYVPLGPHSAAVEVVVP